MSIKNNKKINAPIAWIEAIKDMTKLLKSFHADVTLNIFNKRNALSTDMPRETDGIKVFNIISPIEASITTVSNMLKLDWK